MTELTLVAAGALVAALLAALVMARLTGRWVWLGVPAAVVAGLVLNWQGNAATGHQAGIGEFLMIVFVVAPALIGWVIGSLIGLRTRGRR